MNPITQFVSPSALSATDSTQPSNQFSAPTWGSDKDQGDAYIYVPLKKTVDPKIIVIDSSDEDSSDDEPPDKTLSVHLLANGTASYASGESAGIHPESGSHFMASSCPPQQLDPAASAYPGTSTYICPPQPAAIALSPVNTWPPQHPGDIMWPSPMSHPNGSTSNHYNGSSDYHPNSGFFTYPPPQQANSSMTVYNPQQASTSTCSWSNTTTSLPRDSSSLYPNDVEMISAPASPRVTNMLDEVEDMEVDYPQNPFYQGSLASTSYDMKAPVYGSSGLSNSYNACPSTMIAPNGSAYYGNGPSMPICPPPHPANMYPDPIYGMHPGSSIPSYYQSPGQPICPPQPPDAYMGPGLNYAVYPPQQASTGFIAYLPQQASPSIHGYYPSPSLTVCPPQQGSTSMTAYLPPQQTSTSSCTTTFFPLDCSSLYPNNIEMISAPASPRVTNMLDEVEDMEVDYPQNPFYQGSLARTSYDMKAPVYSSSGPGNSFNVQALVHCFGSSTGNRKRVREAPLDHCGLAEGEPVPKKRKMIVKVNRPRTRRRVR